MSEPKHHRTPSPTWPAMSLTSTKLACLSRRHSKTLGFSLNCIPPPSHNQSRLYFVSAPPLTPLHPFGFEIPILLWF